ncbi:MAG: oligosaccharide flippase family protein, partial [Slackia sp.]
MSESLKSKTAKALVWKFAERGLYQVVAFAVQVVLVRLLAPEQFGAMAIMQVFLALSNSLVQSGFSNAL